MSEPKEYDIVKFKSKTTKADGTLLQTKTGKPMWAVDIQIRERPGIWINGLVFNEPQDWTGTKQKLILDVREYNGKQYPQFKLPRTGPPMAEKYDRMIALLESIDAHLKRIEQDMATEWLRAISRADYGDEQAEGPPVNGRQ